MKKLFLSVVLLLAVSFTFASNGIVKPIYVEKIQTIKIINHPVKPKCTVSCSVTVMGVTFTTTAGNWFSSCERAGMRCYAKLQRMGIE